MCLSWVTLGNWPVCHNSYVNNGTYRTTHYNNSQLNSIFPCYSNKSVTHISGYNLDPFAVSCVKIFVDVYLIYVDLM